MELPETFLKLSLENKRFQKLLQACKNDINSMSKLHGQKKNDEVLEDENSSQSSQTGFDSGLVKKNRIEEIRSNLLTNISSFYTLKYIKILIAIIGLFSLVFSISYIFLFKKLYINLKNTSSLNINLFETTLWTSQLIGIFVSLRTLFERDVINYIKEPTAEKFYFNDYISPDGESAPAQYYNESIKLCSGLYDKILKSYGEIEMEIPKYLNDEQLMNIYWDRVDVFYMSEDYMKYSKKRDDESFPMSKKYYFFKKYLYFIC